MVIGQGLFEGRGGHQLRGEFILEKLTDGVHLRTSDDFFFDGSPAPGFAFAKNEQFTQEQAEATDFHRLPGSGSLVGPQIEVTGVQTAVVPEHLNSNEYDSLFLWCFLTPFLLGVGNISKEGG